MSITCKFLDGRESVLPVVENETVMAYCTRLMDANGVQAYNKTCYYTVLQGSIINRADRRQMKLTDLVDVTKPVFATIAFLGAPSQIAMVKGNMDTNGFEPELLECSICLEKFTSSLGSVKGTFIALDCMHRFHMRCISEIPGDACPICRTRVTDGRLTLYREYARNSAI